MLGADDKAGIAEIMTVVEHLIKENIPHGKICIAFTPDEEVEAVPQPLIWILLVRIMPIPSTAAKKVKSPMRISMPVQPNL